MFFLCNTLLQVKQVDFPGREEDLELRKESKDEKKMRMAWAKDEEERNDRKETEEERKQRKNSERGESEKERKKRKKREKEAHKRKMLDYNDDEDFVQTKKRNTGR